MFNIGDLVLAPDDTIGIIHSMVHDQYGYNWYYIESGLIREEELKLVLLLFD